MNPIRTLVLASALAATVALADDSLKPGLLGRYYQFTALSDFPTQLGGRKPEVERVDKDINFPSTLEEFAGTKLKDNFYAVWTGVIRIPADGKYTFTLESDDGSRLFIDGKEIVDNGGTHEMVEASGRAELKAGDHEIKVEFFDEEEDAGCILSWQAEGKAKEVVPASALFHKGGASAGGNGGLQADYFRMEEGSEDFPNFSDTKTPDLKRVDNQINFESTQDNWPGTEFKEFFYIRWTGFIEIPADGKYTFYLESDDGSRLFIDGKQVLDNGGAHGMEEVPGDINLKAGKHALKVEFFEKDIDAGCIFRWKSDKLEKQVVPASVLSH